MNFQIFLTFPNFLVNLSKFIYTAIFYIFLNLLIHSKFLSFEEIQNTHVT
jgi:hypothetical protein